MDDPLIFVSDAVVALDLSAFWRAREFAERRFQLLAVVGVHVGERALGARQPWHVDAEDTAGLCRHVGELQGLAVQSPTESRWYSR